MGIVFKSFNEYQECATRLAEYPDVSNNLIYPALGLAGEAGEAVDKIKKYWRNEGITSGQQLTGEQKEALAKELGDVLWYIAALAKELGISLGTIASMNYEKLMDRKTRNVIKSEGDNR